MSLQTAWNNGSKKHQLPSLKKMIVQMLIGDFFLANHKLPINLLFPDSKLLPLPL